MNITSKTNLKLMLDPNKDIIQTWTKNCPKCNSLITYAREWDLMRSLDKKSICKRCSAIKNAKKYKTLYKGNGNPFYGKHHSEKTIKKLKSLDKSYMKGNKNPMKQEKLRKYFSKLFTEYNPMKGKHHSKETLKKLSIAMSGKNNPMYGKPPQNGSGNGWANWYDGKHFRSLRELQYYIVEIEGKNINYESAQGKSFRIPYIDYNGHHRTYLPDFFVDNHWIIEIKPRKLWTTKEVILKKNAAENFCKNLGYEYKLIDIIPNSELLKEKYLNGEIKFVKKYVERFEKYAKIKT